jgi:hypothetical protein
MEQALQAELRMDSSQLAQRWQRWVPTFARGSYASQ